MTAHERQITPACWWFREKYHLYGDWPAGIWGASVTTNSEHFWTTNMHKNEFLQPAFLHQRDCSKKQPSLRPPFERRIPLSPNGLIDRRNTITLLISHFRTWGKSRNKTLQSNNVLLLCQSVANKMFIMTTRNKAILDPKKHYKHCANYTK